MQEGRLSEVDAIAKRLSLVIDCALRIPDRTKDVLVCNHGVLFSIAKLQQSGDWSWARYKHDKLDRR